MILYFILQGGLLLFCRIFGTPIFEVSCLLVVGSRKGAFGRCSPVTKFPREGLSLQCYSGRSKPWFLIFLRLKSRNEAILAKTALLKNRPFVSSQTGKKAVGLSRELADVMRCGVGAHRCFSAGSCAHEALWQGKESHICHAARSSMTERMQ